MKIKEIHDKGEVVKIHPYKVDKDIPLPEPLPTSGTAIPLDSLDVEDSILFPSSERPKVQTMASRLKKEKSKEFTVRIVDDVSCRVWRTK